MKRILLFLLSIATWCAPEARSLLAQNQDRLHVLDSTIAPPTIFKINPSTGGFVNTPCSPSIAPSSQSFPPNGGSASVSVTAPAGCTWTSSNVPTWITITSGNSGSGNGTVAYSVSTGAQKWAKSYVGVAASSVAAALAISPDGHTLYVTGQSESDTIDIATIAYRA